MERNYIMKLTKEKLEQLIIEQYKSMSRRIFDKRRQQAQGPGLARAFGDEDQPIDRPEYHSKLTSLAKDDYSQARELADALDEPLDVEFGTSDPETIMMPGVPKGYHDVDGPYFTHARYVMWANTNGYPELTFTSEIVPEAVRAFANSEGMDYEQILSAVKLNLSNVRKEQMRKGLNKFDPDKHMARTHGMDRDPFGDDDF